MKDSVVYKVARHVLHIKIDSTIYVAGIPTDSTIASPVTVILKDTASVTMVHPPLRTVSDSVYVRLSQLDTTNVHPALALKINHAVIDSFLHPVVALQSNCYSYPVSDSIIGSTTDSLIYYLAFDSISAISYTNSEYLSDSAAHYIIHYSKGPVTDSISYITSFYTNYTIHPIYDSSFYYNLNYAKDSVFDSTFHHLAMVTHGAVTDSIITHTVYYTTDSMADTTVYFTDFFNTTYTFDSVSFAYSPISSYPWVQLFPPQWASDTGGGAGKRGMTGIKPIDTSFDQKLKIAISPNPFTDNLHIYINNLEDRGHNGILQVINSLGQEVQSRVVNIEPDAVNDFDLDMASVSKGFYYIVIHDAAGILYKNEFIKQ